MLKCTKFDFRWGSAPDPLAGFNAPTSKGREAKKEGRGRMESGGKMRALEGPTTTKGERRKWIGGREGICQTNVKLLPTPLKKMQQLLRGRPNNRPPARPSVCPVTVKQKGSSFQLRRSKVNVRVRRTAAYHDGTGPSNILTSSLVRSRRKRGFHASKQRSGSLSERVGESRPEVFHGSPVKVGHVLWLALLMARLQRHVVEPHICRVTTASDTCIYFKLRCWTSP